MDVVAELLPTVRNHHFEENTSLLPSPLKQGLPHFSDKTQWIHFSFERQDGLGALTEDQSALQVSSRREKPILQESKQSKTV